MSTRKQVAANRRNAQKSTGPQSAAGKAQVSRNAVKHGLTSRRWVLADEDRDHFLEFSLDMQAELGAEGRLELLLGHRVALALWRLGRVPAIEGELLERLRQDAGGADEGLGMAWARDDGPYGGALGRLTRYEGALERGLARTLAELRRVQAGRRRRERETPAPPLRDPADWWRRAAQAWPGAPKVAAPAPAAAGAAAATASPAGPDPAQASGAAAQVPPVRPASGAHGTESRPDAAPRPSYPLTGLPGGPGPLPVSAVDSSSWPGPRGGAGGA